MTVYWQSTNRRFPWPVWAVGLTSLWVALVVVASVLSQRYHTPGPVCPFKALTGLPCLSCGLTRACFALGAGDVWTAWTYNPLMVTLIAAGAVMAGVRLITGRSLRIELTRWERRLALAALVLVAGANWTYLILAGI